MSRAKKKPCPVCGLPFLKGRIVLRLMDTGAVKQRVCQQCAKLATPVLATEAKARCEVCGKNLARACYGCIGAVIDKQRSVNVAPALAKQAARRKKKVRDAQEAEDGA